MDEDNSKLLLIGTSSFTVASCGEHFLFLGSPAANIVGLQWL